MLPGVDYWMRPESRPTTPDSRPGTPGSQPGSRDGSRGGSRPGTPGSRPGSRGGSRPQTPTVGEAYEARKGEMGKAMGAYDYVVRPKTPDSPGLRPKTPEIKTPDPRGPKPLAKPPGMGRRFMGSIFGSASRQLPEKKRGLFDKPIDEVQTRGRQGGLRGRGFLSFARARPEAEKRPPTPSTPEEGETIYDRPDTLIVGVDYDEAKKERTRTQYWRDKKAAKAAKTPPSSPPASPPGSPVSHKPDVLVLG